MKTGLLGACVGAVIGGILVSTTLVLVLVPVGAIVGAGVGFILATLLSVGNAEEEARCGYQVVCPSTAELVTVKLDPKKAILSELIGSKQQVIRCSGHWNGPPACGYPCVSQVREERTSGALATERNHWMRSEADECIVLQGLGQTKAQAFAELALAATACLAAPNRLHPTESIDIECNAGDDRQLLSAWLHAVVRESRDRGLLLKDFDVRLDGPQLHAKARGQHAELDVMPTLSCLPADQDESLDICQQANGHWLVQSAIQLSPEPATAV